MFGLNLINEKKRNTFLFFFFFSQKRTSSAPPTPSHLHPHHFLRRNPAPITMAFATPSPLVPPHRFFTVIESPREIKVENGGETTTAVLQTIRQPFDQSLVDMAEGLRYRSTGRFIRPVVKRFPLGLSGRRLPPSFTDPAESPLRKQRVRPAVNWAAWRQPVAAPPRRRRQRQTRSMQRRSSQMKTRSHGKGLLR